MSYVQFIFREDSGEHIFLPLVGVIKWCDDGALRYHLHVPLRIGWTEMFPYESWIGQFDRWFVHASSWPSPSAPEVVLLREKPGQEIPLELLPELHDRFLLGLKRLVCEDIVKRHRFANSAEQKMGIPDWQLELIRVRLMDEIENSKRAIEGTPTLDIPQKWWCAPINFLTPPRARE